jgi:anti-anti-sigma factor
MKTPDLCTIETRQTDRCSVARLIGEVDASNAASIDEELRAIAAAARNVFVVDLNELEYIDSAGIAALERLSNETNCRIVIGEGATTYQTLTIVRFNLGHTLYRSQEEALNATT